MRRPAAARRRIIPALVAAIAGLPLHACAELRPPRPPNAPPPETPAAQAPPEPPMITIPPSAAFPKSVWPRPGVPEYTFWARSHGGAVLGAGIREFDWTLQVDARTASVAVESFRSDADMPQHPLGVFRFPVDDQTLVQFHQLIVDANLPALHPAMKNHPGPTQTTYTFNQVPGVMWQKVINNDDHASLNAVAALNGRLVGLLAEGLRHPERAAFLTIAHVKDSLGDRFLVTITNPGVEPVVMTDPRWIQVEGERHRAAVLITEFPERGPGAPPPPLLWRELPMEPLGERPKDEVRLRLDPGGSASVHSAVWRPTPGTRYLVYAVLANYQGEAMVDGVYRVRGRTQSNRIVVTP